MQFPRAQAALGNRAVGMAQLSNDVRQGEGDVISALYVMSSYQFPSGFLQTLNWSEGSSAAVE